MLEIERKYLVYELPDLSNHLFHDITQCYLSFEPEIRIRKKGQHFYLTKKSTGTAIREEVETEIDEVTYEILLSIVKSNVIEKTRYSIPLTPNTVAELDIYHGELDKLTTVEVEFSSEEQMSEFIPPVWFGNDITSDKRYKNKNLASASSDELKGLIGNNDTYSLKKNRIDKKH